MFHRITSRSLCYIFYSGKKDCNGPSRATLVKARSLPLEGYTPYSQIIDQGGIEKFYERGPGPESETKYFHFFFCGQIWLKKIHFQGLFTRAILMTDFADWCDFTSCPKMFVFSFLIEAGPGLTPSTQRVKNDCTLSADYNNINQLNYYILYYY